MLAHLKACQPTVSQGSQETGSALDFLLICFLGFFFSFFFQVPLLNRIKIFHEDSVDELLYNKEMKTA